MSKIGYLITAVFAGAVGLATGTVIQVYASKISGLYEKDLNRDGSKDLIIKRAGYGEHPIVFLRQGDGSLKNLDDLEADSTGVVREDFDKIRRAAGEE